MQEARKKEFLKKLNQEIKKARHLAKSRQKAAKEFASASRSQQGDRLYFEDANHMARGYLNRLLSLKKEVTDNQKTQKRPKTVKSVSFVTLEYQDKHKNSFYFTSTGVTLPGLQLITPNSPLGKTIQGKKEGEKFSYQIRRDDQTLSFSGQVIKIE
jgi:transcription elongation GreA/GreB family factor